MDVFFNQELVYEDKKNKNSKTKKLIFVENLKMFMKNNKTINFIDGARNKDTIFWLKDDNGNEYRQVDGITNKEDLIKAYEVGKPKKKTQLEYNLSRYYYKLVKTEIEKEYNIDHAFQRHVDSIVAGHLKPDFELFKGLLKSPKMGYYFNEAAPNTIYTDMTHIDINSFYSYIMKSQKFPVKFDRVKPEDYKMIFENKIPFCGEFIIETKKHDDFLEKMGDYRIALHQLTGFFNNIDFEFIKELAGIKQFKIIKLWKIEMGFMKESVLRAIDYAYNKKKELTGKPERVRYKFFLERLYGNCLKARFYDYKWIWDNDNDDFLRVESNFTEDEFLSAEFQNQKMTGYFDYAWGVWITSYARYFLLKAKKATGGIYGDTDCLIIKKGIKFNEGIEIGQWKIENEYKELKIVDLKWYCGINNKEELKITCSGANKERVRDYLENNNSNISLFCKEIPVKCFKQERYDKKRDIWYYEWCSAKDLDGGI